MPSTQSQVKSSYLAAFKAANGKEALLEPRDDGFVVVSCDGASTGFTYSEADLVRLTKRLHERAVSSVQN